MRSARAARSVPVLVLPLDIELLFDMPVLEPLPILLLPVPDEVPMPELLDPEELPIPELLEPELLDPELLIPLELVLPVVDGEPLAGCERSPCDKPEVGGVVVLLEPLVPIDEPLVPVVEPLVPIDEPVLVEPDC